MKGIILAGGNGTRLRPLTSTTSKQLLAVYDRQLIFYPLNTLLKSGITEILIIVKSAHQEEFMSLLGDGSQFDARLTFAVQDDANGLPEAFVIGKDFIDDDSVTLILGDNFFTHEFCHHVRDFAGGAKIFALEHHTPQHYGVIEIAHPDHVISIEEKPQNPKSNYIIPGIYIFDNTVIERAQNCTPSNRDETEIVDLISSYREHGPLSVARLHDGFWKDAGTPRGLVETSLLAMELLPSFWDTSLAAYVASMRT